MSCIVLHASYIMHGAYHGAYNLYPEDNPIVLTVKETKAGMKQAAKSQDFSGAKCSIIRQMSVCRYQL